MRRAPRCRRSQPAVMDWSAQQLGRSAETDAFRRCSEKEATLRAMDIPFQDPALERAPEDTGTRVKYKHCGRGMDSAKLAVIKNPATGRFLPGQNGVTRGK